jgi:hypothetical protein
VLVLFGVIPRKNLLGKVQFLPCPLGHAEQASNRFYKLPAVRHGYASKMEIQKDVLTSNCCTEVLYNPDSGVSVTASETAFPSQEIRNTCRKV